MNVEELAQLLNASLSSPSADFDCLNFSHDTRSLQPGDVYIALCGNNFDGHEFIADAKAKGAVAVIAEREVAVDLPTLVVKDARQAFGQIAHAHRMQFGAQVIALTGSSGKTTVKEMIAAILRLKGPVLATFANHNNDIGVPQTLLQLNAEHQYAVIEIGTNHPGEIRPLTAMAQPDVALVNNIGPAHIGFFPDLKALTHEKTSIYQEIKPGGKAVLNMDCPYQADWLTLPDTVATTTFSLSQHADFTATEVETDENGTRFQMRTPIGSAKIQLQYIGQHHVANALAASACCVSVGVDLETITQGLASVKPALGRAGVLAGPAGSRLIDDTYNANPASVKAALDMLATYPNPRLFVFGGMGELGEHAKRYHEEIGTHAKARQIDELFAVGPLSESTCAAFGENAQHFVDQSSLVEALLPKLNAGVTCLIKGSRSAKMENVIEAMTALKT